MKKLMILMATALLLAVAMPADAQGVQFGVKAGLNISKLSFDEDVIESENQTGYFIGPTVELTLPMGLGFNVAALYDRQGIKLKDALKTGDEAVSRSETLNFVDVPVNVVYNLGLGKTLGIYLATGPQFSFNVGDRDIFKETYKLKSSTLSWNVGAGVKVAKHVQVGYNYNIALGKTVEEAQDAGVGKVLKDEYNNQIEGDAKNYTHQISVAWMF